MQSNSIWRARAAQTLLPSSTLLAGYILPGLSRIQTWNRRLILRIAGVIALTALASGPVFAQKESGGYPEDWTHHHVVFSDPGTLHGASGRGSFDSWYKTVTDPRFTIQQHRRGEHPHHGKGNQGPQTPQPLDRDWSATLGGAGVAPGMFPAKWTFSVTAAPSCNDYIVFPVNKAGAAGSQPNIVGYKNLYVNAGSTGFCAGTTPTVLFSYYVGTGTVQTSPVLGPSVGQVAYVESIAGGSKFHVLKGAGTGASNGTVAVPVAPGTGNTATDVAVTLNGAVSVTRSSPFYDYSNDIAYVGDDSGKLHKITPVFNGTPAEVTTGGVWPVTVSTQVGKILTGPLTDNVTGRIFVGDSQGFLYSVNSTTGAVTQSGQLGSGTGIVEPPMVDSTASSVYVFVGDNAGGTASAVYVFNISSGDITAASTGSNVTVGTNSATVPLYGGAFDNNYFSSANSTQPAGNLYVCGNAGSNPTLYQIPISYSGGPALGSVVTGPILAGSNVACSPLTEFFNSNTSTDWLFAGVPGTSCGAGIGAGGCVMSFNITSAAPTIGPWTPSTAYTSTSEVVDTLGQLQKCTGGGCLIAGATSGTTTPAWTGGPGTTTDGATTAASSVGTVSANSAVAGATVTIGSVTLTASTPTKASSPILIIAEPGGGSTITINGTVYDWRANAGLCNAGENCVQRSANLGTEATNLINAINGTSCFNTCVGADPTVKASAGAANTVIITAIIPGSGPNADVLATSQTGAMHINGAANASTTLGAGTGTLGSDGSNAAPNFQWTGAGGLLTTAQLAANIVAAITPAEETTAGIAAPTYTGGNTFFTIAAASPGAAGNSITVGGTLTGFSWNPSGHLAGGNNQLTWTYQSASNGQTTAAEATGTSGIVIDNVGSGTGEANIYFGTLSGTGATNTAVKMTQAGLQ